MMMQNQKQEAHHVVRKVLEGGAEEGTPVLELSTDYRPPSLSLVILFMFLFLLRIL